MLIVKYNPMKMLLNKANVNCFVYRKIVLEIDVSRTRGDYDPKLPESRVNRDRSV